MSIAEIGSVMETADVKIVFNKIKNDPTSAAKAYKQISSNYKPKSIAALARDQIMTFPIYMSGDIPAEAGVTIIKALEKQYSVFAMLALSNHLNYDSTKYNSLGDVISEIHSNEDHPNLLKYVVNLGDNISNFIKMTDPSVRESMLPQTVVMSADELAALDYNLRDEITTESLNDYYQPNHHNIEKTIITISKRQKQLWKVSLRRIPPMHSTMLCFSMLRACRHLTSVVVVILALQKKWMRKVDPLVDIVK